MAALRRPKHWLETAPTESPLDARPAVEAIDDLDWYYGEGASALGARSALGATLERQASLHEWCAADRRDREEGAPGHYGSAFAEAPWQEWVEDPRHPGGVYTRAVWGARRDSTRVLVADDSMLARLGAGEQYRAVAEVLSLVPPALRAVLEAQHNRRVVTFAERKIFGAAAWTARLSRDARAWYRAQPRGQATLAMFLAAVADRVAAGLPGAGDVRLVERVKREMDLSLRKAYFAYEASRELLPARSYPHYSKRHAARRRSLVGGTSS